MSKVIIGIPKEITVVTDEAVSLSASYADKSSTGLYVDMGLVWSVYGNRYVGMFTFGALGEYIVKIADGNGLIKDLYVEVKVVTADIDVVIPSIAVDMGVVADVEAGNWEIIGTQMVFYKRDGSELMRYDLFDSNGVGSAIDVVKRVKV